MSKADDDKPKVKRRRTRATIGGTTQSGFASRSMSEILKAQRNREKNEKRGSSAAHQQDPRDGDPNQGKS